MRCLLIFSLLFSVFSGLQSQFNIDWRVRIGENESAIIRDVIETHDGNILVLGSMEQSALREEDFYLALLSADGDVMWEKLYGGSERDVPISVLEVSDGFVIFGDTNSDNGDITQHVGEQDIWVLKVNLTGEIIWDKTHGNLGSDGVFDVIMTADDGFLLLTYFHSSTSIFYPWRVVLLKLDKQGRMEWTRRLADDEIDLAGNELIEDSQGNYIVGSTSLEALPFIVGRRITKVSQDGDIIWEKLVESGDINCNTWAIDLMANDDIVLGGSCDGDANILRLDNLGDIVWKQRIGAIGDEEILDLIVTEEGNILAVGYTTSDDIGLETGDRDVLLIELNGAGDLLWKETFGNTLLEYTQRIISVQDGSYVLGSRIDLNIEILKFSLQSTATEMPKQSLKFSLFPNPTFDVINVNLASQNLGSSYTIQNKEGQRIGSGILENPVTAISVKSLPIGSYIFNVIHDGVETHKKFVKL